MKQNTWAQLFIIYTRYLIGFAFIFASIVKLQGLRFTAESGAESPINSAWHFFETLYLSGIYWKFLGFVQLVAGSLLITQRYPKLGAVMFLPIIANVFIITISYDFNGTPIITGLMLLATILLLFWDWDSLKVLVNKKPTASDKKRLEHDSIWIILGIIFFIATISVKFIISTTALMPLFISFPIIGLIGLIIGYKRRKLY
ncbi:hypothetical protein H3Z83_00285 [Tenacibaculum sp. S7007]|uniref:DoxX family protein n=1 Tax=Tenacibaculum pelagium TaxID=2759527 RepID=A0A839AMG1_9FLAO|nr:hypothetical protein [Tenacibaculum pelagium]MBA6154961.1 hypothetical protein [Tenacibaculum pelagium]